jgi:hypothetical protein
VQQRVQHANSGPPLVMPILLTWTASLALPVFTSCRTGYDHVGGWVLLLLGWLGLLTLMPARLANFLIVGIGGALFFHRRPPIWLGVLTAILAGTAWWWKAWGDDTGELPIRHYHEGYWLWLTIAALTLLATIIARFSPSTSKNQSLS